MAAIDPSAEPEQTGTVKSSAQPRATLKMVYDPAGPGDDGDDEDDEESYLKTLLAGQNDDAEEEEEEDDDDDEDDEEDSDDDEEKNGGPSDPSKTKKARKQAALEQILSSMGDDEDQEEMDVDGSPKVNGLGNKANKGKGKALDEADEDAEEEEEEDEDDLEKLGMEEVVICTLDPEKASNFLFYGTVSSITDGSRHHRSRRSECVLQSFWYPYSLSHRQLRCSSRQRA